MNRSLSVLCIEEGEGWSAQCLEYDLATQAPTLPALYAEVERMITGTILVSLELGLEPFADIDPAPQRF